MAMHGAAASMWDRTDLRPSDLDLVQAYDGFSFVSLLWLEALQVCSRGEAGAFVDGGARISLGGELPLNTSGGQLSGGRLHGFGLLYEAVVQLRGDAGERQVPHAEVAAVTGGATTLAGSLLLTTVR
jgi:acetyl-CoA acetyltransferase